MRSLLSLFISVLCLFSCALAANIPRLDRQPPPGKGLYTIYPKNGTDTSKTSDFIKNVVGAEDLFPWTTLRNQLVSWTVEASTNEAAQLQGYTDIDRVNEFHPPKPPHSSMNATQTARDTAAVERHAKRQENPVKALGWFVFPRDNNNKTENEKTQQLLQQLLGQEHVTIHNKKDQLRFWLVDSLTDSQRDQITKDPGVRKVEEDIMGDVAKLSNAKEKRVVSYSTQIDPVSELVVMSQPSTVPSLAELNNYVYDGTSGKSSFIYHLETGVEYKAHAAEFPHVAADNKHLQTQGAKAGGHHPWEDDLGIRTNWHSTCTAGKALGQTYGTSKQATLIVVQMLDVRISEIIDALIEIALDITSNLDERYKKSVVTMSLSGGFYDPNNPDSEVYKEIQDAVKDLWEIDTPVVAAAGNAADKGHPTVDTVPQIFAGPDFPLLVVGSTNNEGRLSDFSQRGPQVLFHFPGEHATCLGNPDAGVALRTGTSFATAMVAGQIANLLSQDPVPFDTADGKLVVNLKDYLNSDAGSWARTPGVRVVWNGVTEANNPKIPPPAPESPPPPPATAPPPNPPPANTVGPLQCTGLTDRKYVEQRTLSDLIKLEFCPAAVQQGVQDTNSGSLMRRYNEGTMEDVSISMKWPPGIPFKPNTEDCHKYLLGNVVDGCDGNDPKNPENYKAGGSIKVGEVEYRIEPQAVRQQAAEGKTGGCSTTYKGFHNEAWMWGHGWASGDHGAALKEAVKGCALLPDTWSFEYGLGDDGREWTAKFRTGVFQNSCTGHAGTDAGAPAGFDCGGSG